MAGQANNEQSLSDAEKKFNRQINFFIMRYMWQVICGRNGEDTIYKTFKTSRERYTRIINTGAVRYAIGELDFLTEVTGLKRGIFTGEVRFKCPYKDGKTPKEITQEEWDTMFQWREERSREKGTKSPQAEVCEKLQKVKRTDADNWDFYQLCYFLKERKPAPPKLAGEYFRDIVYSIQRLSFSMLDGCRDQQLTDLQKILREKTNLFSGIIACRKAKAEEEKAKGKGKQKN